MRFFDVGVADAWYAQGPFLKAVPALGWAVVVVLTQEEYDIDQEAWALTQGPPHRGVPTRGARDPPLGSARPDLLPDPWPSGAGGAGRGNMDRGPRRGWPQESRAQTVRLVMGGGRAPRRIWGPDPLEPRTRSVADRKQRFQRPDEALASAARCASRSDVDPGLFADHSAGLQSRSRLRAPPWSARSAGPSHLARTTPATVSGR